MIVMMLLSSLVALWPIATGSPDSCGDAEKLYEGEYFKDAAASFECRWRRGGAPKGLYWAAVSLTRADARPAAAQMWQRYLALPNDDPKRHQRATQQYDELKRRLRSVHITVHGRDPASPLVLVFTPEDAPAGPPALTVNVAAGRDDAEVLLERSPLSVRAEQSSDKKTVASLDGEVTSLRLSFTRPARSRRGLIAGFAVGVPLAFAGGVVLGFAGPRIERVGLEAGCTDRDPACLASIHRALHLRDAGVGVLSASLPAMMNGAISTASSQRQRKILWSIEFVVGAVATAAGAAIVVTETAKIDDRFNSTQPETPAHSLESTGRAVGSALLGFGASAVGGAGLGLIFEVRSQHAPRTEVVLQPRVNPTFGGVELGFNF